MKESVIRYHATLKLLSAFFILLALALVYFVPANTLIAKIIMVVSASIGYWLMIYEDSLSDYEMADLCPDCRIYMRRVKSNIEIDENESSHSRLLQRDVFETYCPRCQTVAETTYSSWYETIS